MARPQVIIGGGNLTYAVGTYYTTPFGGCAWDANEDRRRAIASPPGRLMNFRVEVDMAPGGGDSYTFTIMKNGAAQSLAVTISGADTSGEDTTHEVTLAAGDYVTLRSTYSGSPGHPTPRWSLHFVPHTANNYWLSGIVHCNTGFAAYGNLYGCGNDSSTRGDEEAPMPVAGTVSDLYVRLNLDPGTAPDTYRWTMEKNGVGAFFADVVADDITGSNTSDTESYAAGDRISLECTPINVPTISSWGAYGVTFVPDTAGKAPVLFAAGDVANPSTADPQYQQPSNQAAVAWSDTDVLLALLNECTIEDLYVYLQTAPGAGKSWTFNLRKNGADTDLSVTISDAAQSGNDTTHSVSGADGDDLSMESNPSNSPASSRTAWGFIVEAPAARTQIIVGGGKGIVSEQASPYYTVPFGGFSFVSDEHRGKVCASPPGTIQNFRLRLSVAPGADNSYTFTFRKNGADTTLVITISDTDTTGEDTTHSFTVAPGDVVALQFASSGTPPDSVPSWSFEFVPNIGDEFWLGGMQIGQAAGTRYSPLYGGFQVCETEANEQAPMPIAGTFKNLYLVLDQDPGDDPDAYIFTLRINGDDGNLTVTITAPAATGSDTTNTDAVAANDDVNLNAVPQETPGTVQAAFGFTFVPSTSGRAPVLTGSSGFSLVPGAYNTMGNRLYAAWSGDEDKFVLTSAAQLRNLYCKVDVAPGATNSWTFTLRRNEADTTLTVTIADPDTEGSDTTHSESVSAGDLLSMKSARDGADAAALRHGFTIEVITGPNIASVNGVLAANIAEVDGVEWASIGKIDGVG